MFSRIRNPSGLWRSPAWILLASVMAGAVSGWLAASVYLSPSDLRETFDRLWQERPTATTTIQRIETISVESRPTPSVYPLIFASRQISPVGTLVTGVGRKKLEPQIYWQRNLGQAVAMTADGWFATTALALERESVEDIRLLWNQHAWPLEQVIRDKATDAIFLKVAAQQTPIVALAPSVDVVSGALVFVERFSGQLVPDIVMDTRTGPSSAPISSERAVRRFMISSKDVQPGSLGTAVWDQSGRLIGLLESLDKEGGKVLPAGDLIPALSLLLTDKSIVHPVLGVRATDVLSMVFPISTSTYPATGAWIRGWDGMSAVSHDGPAAGHLLENDVITHVERDILDGGADLGERILEYRPGTPVLLRGLRKGTAFETTIILGSATTSEILFQRTKKSSVSKK